MPPQKRSQITFLAGGDVAINRPRGRGAFGTLAGLFRKADVAFANLEVPLSRNGRPAPEKILLRGTPEMVEALNEAGFDALSVANNHMLDYGEEAFFDTFSLLDEHAISYAGAGKNLAAARRPVVLERGGLKIGVLVFSSLIPRGFAAGQDTPGLNPLRALTSYRPIQNAAEYPGAPLRVLTWADPDDLQRMKRDIRALKKKVDLVLVNHHWGTSMMHEIREYQQEVAYAAVDSGADIVLGGHPHVVQGVEFYKGKPIVYSMGNLIFDFKVSFFTDVCRQTFLFGCRLTKKGAEAPYLLPCWSGDLDKPAPLSPHRGKGKAIAELMRRLCHTFGTQIQPEGEKLLLRPGQRPEAKRISYTSL